MIEKHSCKSEFAFAKQILLIQVPFKKIKEQKDKRTHLEVVGAKGAGHGGGVHYRGGGSRGGSSG